MVYATHSNHIPSVDLTHNNQPVNFAFRTMEEIDKRTKGEPDAPHRHNYYTVLWAKKACGYHYIDFVEYSIEPDRIFFVTPGQVHQVATFANPEGIVIMFTEEFLVENLIPSSFINNLGLFSETASTPPIKVNKQGKLELLNISSKIENEFHSQNQFKYESLGAYLKLFLIHCNQYAHSLTEENTQMVESGRELITKFKSLVENHYPSWHKVQLYADSLNITSDYLNNLIKSILGKTAKNYIQNRIALEAKRMGIHTEMNSKEIAYQLGFDDPSHFSKFFKNISGESFTEFRKHTDMAH